MTQIDVHRLVQTLEPQLHGGLEAAASLAARHAHPTVEVAHWLRALLDDGVITDRFALVGLDAGRIRVALDEVIADLPRQDGASLTLSSSVLALAREAWLVASMQFGRKTISFWDLLIAVNSDPALRMLVRGIAPDFRNLDTGRLEELAQAQEKADDEPSGNPSRNAPRDDEFLKLYTHDLTEDARAGKIDPVIGRERELRQLIDVLMRRRQNNPIPSARLVLKDRRCRSLCSGNRR